MKTIIKEYTVYSFNELSNEAQNKALKKYQDINTDFEWYDSVYEWFKDTTIESGFDVEKIYFSGFWSQGDGAMFEFSDPGTGQLLKEFIDQLDLSQMRKNWLLSQTFAKISGKHSGRYYHSKSVSFSITFESNFAWNSAENFHYWIESFYSDFEDFVTSKYEDLCDKLYLQLEREYNYLISPEAIIETFEANEYQFTEDGLIH
jgi:hypothetical protein